MTTATHLRPPAEQLLDVIVEAADLALDEAEYEIALESIALVALDYDDDSRIPAEWLVTEIEKDIGLGLDERRFAQAVTAARGSSHYPLETIPGA
jgi:hypothetical protein